MPARIVYNKGQVVGDHGLVFLEEVSADITTGGSVKRRASFKCVCDMNFTCHIASVKSGNTKSCGCHKEKVCREMGKACASDPSHKFGMPKDGNVNWRGGVRSHDLYGTWSNMKARCLKKDHKNYDRYGGRGIGIHEPWINDSVAFIEWIEKNLGDRPEGHTLDRIDNDGNYEPGNLRWATQSQQNSNKRRVRRPARYWGYNE